MKGLDSIRCHMSAKYLTSRKCFSEKKTFCDVKKEPNAFQDFLARSTLFYSKFLDRGRL